MMRTQKWYSALIVIVLIVVMALSLVACVSNNDGTLPDGPTDKPTPDKPIDKPTPDEPIDKPTPEKPTPDEPEEKPTEFIPSAQQIVDARSAENDKNEQRYDFKINLKTTAELAGFGGELNGNYNGKYSYNKVNKNLKFYRKTSGSLLYDANEYIYTEQDSRIKVVANEKNEVSRISIIDKSQEELDMINMPFVEIINILDSDNLEDIKHSVDKSYQFSAKMKINTQNECINKLVGLVGKLGASINIKDVSLDNPANGIQLLFNLDEKNQKLNTFKFVYNVTFPFKGANVGISISYEQNASSADIVGHQPRGYLQVKVIKGNNLI